MKPTTPLSWLQLVFGSLLALAGCMHWDEPMIGIFCLNAGILSVLAGGLHLKSAGRRKIASRAVDLQSEVGTQTAKQ